MKSKRSHEEWKKLMLDYQQSGLSMSGFCKNNNLVTTTFIYWVKMFSASAPVAKMIKLNTKPAEPHSDKITISVNNIKLEITGIIEAEKLNKLMTVLLEGCGCL